MHQLHGLLSLSTDARITDTQLKQILGQVKTQMGNTMELTDNLLLWAKSQMAGFKVSKKSFNLHNLVVEKISLYKGVADTKGIKLINEVPRELDIYSDQDIVSLSIHNVIGNSVKFCTDRDSVTISFENLSGVSLVCIQDTGIGMSRDQLKNIFNNSHQSTRGTANEKGSGLGLRICNDLIGQLGGKIWMESEPGNGTKVYLDFQVKHKDLAN